VSYESWLLLAAWENTRASSTLPCICCDRLVTKEESVPGTFGDVSCEGIDIGTVCRDPKCRNDTEAA
jgi:hypothetical protein